MKTPNHKGHRKGVPNPNWEWSEKVPQRSWSFHCIKKPYIIQAQEEGRVLKAEKATGKRHGGMKEHGTFRELAIPGQGASHSPTHGICLTASPWPPPPCLRQPFPLTLNNTLHCSVRHAQFSSSPFCQLRTPQFCHSLPESWKSSSGEEPSSSLLQDPRPLSRHTRFHFSATTRWSPYIQFFYYCQTHPF